MREASFLIIRALFIMYMHRGEYCRFTLHITFHWRCALNRDNAPFSSQSQCALNYGVNIHRSTTAIMLRIRPPNYEGISLLIRGVILIDPAQTRLVRGINIIIIMHLLNIVYPGKEKSAQNSIKVH